VATYPTWAAGQRLTAGLLTASQWQTIIKTADQNSTNTTLVNATDMAVPLDANATYIVNLTACYGASTTADIKLNWTLPTGASMQRYTLGAQAGTTDTAATSVVMRRRSSTNSTPGGDGTGNFTIYMEQIIARTSSTAGSMQLQFAQNATDSANATVLRADSYIQYIRIA
jgi:hypothetical protein